MGCAVTGLDVTSAMLSVARATGPPGITYVEGSAESLPFASNTFSSAYVCAAVVYFLDIPGALREIYRVLRPGGTFAYQAVSADSYVIGLALEHGCARALGADAGGKTFRVPNVVTNTEEDNGRLMREAGFVNVEIVEDVRTENLGTSDMERWWKGSIRQNALTKRLDLLTAEQLSNVKKEFVEFLEQRRNAEGFVEDSCQKLVRQGCKDAKGNGEVVSVRAHICSGWFILHR